MARKSRTGRPKLYNDRTSTSFSCERAVLDDFLELCWREKTSLSEKLQTYMEEELKKEKGILNPIKIEYNTQNKVMSLLHYLQETIVDMNTISQECSRIDDQKTLARLKGVAYTINQCADQQSMLLRNRGVKI